MGKKNLYALLGGLLLTACSESGAGDALQDYLDAMQNKDYVAFVDGMNFKKQPTQEQKEQFAALIGEKAEKNGNVEEYNVVGDSVIVEDSLAIVTYEVVYKDGSKDLEKQPMVKKDGKWLMEIGK